MDRVLKERDRDGENEQGVVSLTQTLSSVVRCSSHLRPSAHTVITRLQFMLDAFLRSQILLMSRTENGMHRKLHTCKVEFNANGNCINTK